MTSSLDYTIRVKEWLTSRSFTHQDCRNEAVRVLGLLAHRVLEGDRVPRDCISYENAEIKLSALLEPSKSPCATAAIQWYEFS